MSDFGALFRFGEQDKERGRMARPRKDSGEQGAEERMMREFWYQLARAPYREITAASVARESRCNRATFYYHFDSIEDLAEKAVAVAVPSGIADLAEAFLTGSADRLRLDEEKRRAVERLCLLTGDRGSPRLTERFKHELMAAWAERFGLELEREEAHVVASFMASGIVGILGEQAGKPCDDAFDERLQTISRVFSASAIEFARASSVLRRTV